MTTAKQLLGKFIQWFKDLHAVPARVLERA
jgi:hypothetical protein